MIAEYNTSGTILRRYVPGRGTDETLVWYEGSGTGVAYWLQTDQQGSTVAVSNSSGAADMYAYSPSGEPRGGWNPSDRAPIFRYTGQAALPQIGLYYYKARMYDPVLGRFLQTDPVGYKNEYNLYSYVGNDPVNMVDPSGLWTCGSNSYFQCSAVSESLETLQKDISGLPRLQQAIAQRALTAYGKEGQANGVVVQAGQQRAPMMTSTKDGITTVAVRSDITSARGLAQAAGVHGVASSGAFVGHEGIHIFDERRRWRGRDPVTSQEGYDTERRGYELQGHILRAEHASQSGLYSNWAETWRGADDERWIIRNARGNAMANHSVPGPVANPW